MRSDAKNMSSGRTTKKKLTIRQKLIVVLGVLLGLVIIVFASAYGVFLHYYNKMNITSLKDNYEIVTAIDYEEDEINVNELTDEERAQLDEFFEEANSFDEDSVSSETADGKKTDGKKNKVSSEDGLDENSSDDDTASETGTTKKDTAANTVKATSKDVTNILLVGTDSRQKGNKRSRTDTMVILSIDKKNKRLTMTSVLRDTYVKIPGVGKNRLNAAFVFGGPKLLFKTFEENFGIHLDKYVQIDFYNFITSQVNLQEN